MQQPAARYQTFRQKKEEEPEPLVISIVRSPNEQANQAVGGGGGGGVMGMNHSNVGGWFRWGNKRGEHQKQQKNETDLRDERDWTTKEKNAIGHQLDLTAAVGELGGGSIFLMQGKGYFGGLRYGTESGSQFHSHEQTKARKIKNKTWLSLRSFHGMYTYLII